MFILETPTRKVYAIMDGMGGHQGGAFASGRAKNLLTVNFGNNPPLERVEGILQDINTSIKDIGDHRPELKGMGCTIVLAIIENGKIYVWNAGDSPAYLMIKTSRGFEAKPLHTEHSWVAGMKGPGFTEEDARFSPQRSMVSAALGQAGTLTLASSSSEIPIGSYLVLASDGIEDVVTPREMEAIFAKNPSAEDAGRELLALAKSRGDTSKKDESNCYTTEFGEKLPGKDDDKSIIVLKF